MRIITIDVTRADIDASIEEHDSRGCSCPVTRAAIRAGLRNPWTTKTDIRYGCDDQLDSLDKGRRIDLPQSVRDIIDQFDRRMIMQPFFFQIEVPDDL